MLSRRGLGPALKTLALSRQTVSRALHDLAQDNVIKQERRRIRVLDLGKLRERLPA